MNMNQIEPGPNSMTRAQQIIGRILADYDEACARYGMEPTLSISELVRLASIGRDVEAAVKR